MGKISEVPFRSALGAIRDSAIRAFSDPPVVTDAGATIPTPDPEKLPIPMPPITPPEDRAIQLVFRLAYDEVHQDHPLSRPLQEVINAGGVLPVEEMEVFPAPTHIQGILEIQNGIATVPKVSEEYETRNGQ